MLTTPLTIISDTRQKRGHHKAKEQYFAENGIQVINSKLPAGDYALLTDMSRVVDTKKDLGEWKTVPEPKSKPPTDNVTLMKIMYTMQVKHGVRWEFCNPKDAGRRVIEILTEGKEVT